MPRLADTQPSHYFHYQPQPHAYAHAQLPDPAPRQVAQGCQSQQISPLSTSNNGSPSSPKPNHPQRLRPLYMPAVLRPTEHPHKKAPYNKSEGEPQTPSQDDDRPMSSANSFISLPGLGAWSLLSRRSTGESGKSLESEWNLDLFPEPTALPTRHHWKPDAEATICDEPSCLRHFNYWTRRHHCRRCGNIFCDLHSTLGVPLDQNANYNPRGAISRACGHCYSEFQAWRTRTNSEASSDGSPVNQVPQTAPASPITTTLTGITPPAPHPAEIAMSVPRDWHWSTF
ncbi:putative zinc finger protein [Rosellinia necatrix]|uniref:Putative zinc finger protein n=1 Tax=Rosellinia necatrix TaxID=77044 RepID=A0A1S8A6P0_ROSNE|nr:putative zinc finger protein [Rosellinia necatrix]